MKFKKIIQRGQALVLYGLLIPTLFVVIGVGLDLGWYYLNVSRLQNAADAAALAGAFELTEKDKTMKDYFVDGLTSEPSGVKDENYYSSFNVDTGEGIDTINLKKNNLNQDELKAGKTEAHSYATKNLYDVTDNHPKISGTSKTINEWTNNKNVTFSATLFTRILDADREKYSKIASTGFRYYKVQLTEKIAHLFMPGWFAPMDATVVAWAVIKPRDIDLNTILNDLSGYKTIQNVIYQDKNKNNPEVSYKGKWAHFQDQGVYYTAGDVNRTEVVNVHNDLRSQNSKSDRYQNQWTVGGGNDNGADLDSLNLDFLVEYGFTNKFAGKDWDLRSDLPNGGTRTNVSWAKGWTSTDKAADMRLITSFNFNYAWTDRNPNDLQTDVLWTHIESDPLWFEYGSSWNSVHQIVLNAHEDNTTTATDAATDINYYTKRPFFIFYMGPEVYNINSTVRVSQPVILNLYNDWNAVLYMPNSPVIINGNGHKLTGFVVAKEYRRLKTAKDMEDEGYIKVTDGYGKTIFVKEDADYIFTEDELTQLAKEKGYTKSIESDGSISFYEKVEAPKYLTLSVNKTEASNYADFTAYINATYKTKFMTATGLSESEIDIVTFPTGQNLCDDERYVVAKTDIVDAIPANATVEYVKVLRHFVENDEDKTEEKYIPKNSLPYVKVRRNSNRPYVSVYDFHKTKANGDSAVTITDDSITVTGSNTNADLWKKDDHYIDKTLLTGTYDKEYIDSKLIFVEEDGLKYFIRKSERPTNSQKLIAEYRKFTDADGNVFYVKEKEWTSDNAAYYMEVLPDGATGKDADGNDITNSIIVDNWGDLQSVPITPTEILTIDTKSANTAAENNSAYSDYLKNYTRATTKSADEIEGYPIKEQPSIDPGTITNGKYRGTSAGRVDETYRVPVLERVYKSSESFNLREDSCYSYFGVEELERINFTYFNVNELEEIEDENGNKKPDPEQQVKDMFFTTVRASWID